MLCGVRLSLVFLALSGVVALHTSSWSPRQRQEREQLEGAGGLCIILRYYSGSVKELPIFLHKLGLYWPRHLAFENVTLVADAEHPKDWWDGLALASSFPNVRVVFEPLPEAHVPLAQVFPGREVSPGHDRQQYSTLLFDRYCQTEFLAMFDTDAFLVAPVTLADLFDTRTMTPYLAYVQGPYYRAGQDVALPRHMTHLGAFMTKFPIVLRRSTLQLTRNAMMERTGKPTFAEAFGVAALTGSYSQFSLAGHVAYYSQHHLYSFELHRSPIPAKAHGGAPCSVADGPGLPPGLQFAVHHKVQPSYLATREALGPVLNPHHPPVRWNQQVVTPADVELLHHTFLCIWRPDMNPRVCSGLLETYGIQALTVMLWESETDRLTGPGPGSWRGRCSLRRYFCRLARSGPGQDRRRDRSRGTWGGLHYGVLGLPLSDTALATQDTSWPNLPTAMLHALFDNKPSSLTKACGDPA